MSYIDVIYVQIYPHYLIIILDIIPVNDRHFYNNSMPYDS